MVININFFDTRLSAVVGIDNVFEDIPGLFYTEDQSVLINSFFNARVFWSVIDLVLIVVNSGAFILFFVTEIKTTGK